MKKTVQEKINSLNKHLEKTIQQLSNPSKKHDTPGKLESYKKWVAREIAFTKETIRKLNE